MTLTKRQPKTWLCPKCGTRNEATKSRKCGGCKVLSRPRRRVPKHAQTLRDDSYDVYALLSQTIHGGENEACGVCGKPKPDNGRHDRDHGHRSGELDYGKPRGLACGGNQGCNVLMVPWVTATTAKGIAAAKRAKGERDAERWALIAAYLGRVESYYAKGDDEG